MLLPKTGPYTELVIKDSHDKAFHSGPQSTLAAIRCTYWIPQARKLVRKIVHNCKLCRRHLAKPFHMPSPPPLPGFRCSIKRPFECVGMDYLGPLIIRDGDSQRKVWVALYTCAVIRAVYLDVVESLNTTDFLLCLRRFMASHGRPAIIVSYNAKQFRLAERVLKKLWLEILHTEDVQTFATSNGITWKFITELAPWMGGFYERMVKPVKEALRKSLGPPLVNHDELHTLLVEVAAIVNDRPLLYQGPDPGEAVLTPNHLMFKARSLFPEVADVDEYRDRQTKADELVNHWKKGQAMLRRFWDSWKGQYLQSLRVLSVRHPQRNTSDSTPRVGMTVLIKDNLPRGMWRFGRIASLIVSADGQVRSAKVKLANGHVLPRPLKLLCHLEIANESGTSSPATSDKASGGVAPTRAQRLAAKVAAQRTKQMLQDQA